MLNPTHVTPCPFSFHSPQPPFLVPAPPFSPQLWLWMRPKTSAQRNLGSSLLPSSHNARRVPLSPEASHMSFGHFLQLAFAAENLFVGGLSLHYDFVRYVGLGKHVLCFYQVRVWD